MKKRFSLLAASALLVLGLGQNARAGSLFVIGSTFTDSGGNTPDSFSTPTILQAGTTSPDGGALNLTIADVISGGNEWLVFTYQTATPGTALSNPAEDWNVFETGLDLAVPANFIGAYAAFLDSNGDSITPTSSIFPGYSVEANPVPGGVGIGIGTSFFAPVPAGPLGGLGAFIDPWGALDSTGVPSANVEGFVQALEFSPQATSTPEPASFALFGAGMLGLGLMRRLKRTSQI